MTTYFAISGAPPQFEITSGVPASGYVLKAYAAGTSTPISMATDYTGNTLVSTITLNASGYPAVSGNVVIPHIAVNYKLALYPSQAAADSNTGAIWNPDNTQVGGTGTSEGALTDVASASTLNLNSTATNYFNVTGTTGITSITLAEGSVVTVKFADALTITHSATLILKNGLNITTVANDTAVFRGESGGVVRLIDYSPYDTLVAVSKAQTLSNKTFADPVITLTTTQTVTNADAGATGCSVEYYHNSASPALSDLQQISYAFNSSTGVKRTFNNIRAVIEDATDTSEDSRFDFLTINAGTLATRMKLTQGLVVGTPTGDDKGAGTINAVAVYDDNVLLTCYVFDQAVEGSISLDKWDSKVPDRENEARIHESARKFKTRISSKYDPLTLDGYAAHWKEKKHLTSMPNEENFNPVDGMAMGAWVQRLIETVEIQAVLIEQLNQEIKNIKKG